MSDALNKATVLVLNRNWQAINVRTPAEAFCQMCTGSVTALDIDAEGSMRPVRWSEWLELPVRENDVSILTPRGLIRVPTVIVLARYSRVPKKRPRFSAKAIWERDGHRCQYTGRVLKAGEGNIDHVIPRSRGGKTSWDNCVLASKEVNTKKGNRLPEEIGLRLLKAPKAPVEVPTTILIRNHHKIPDWDHFLLHTSRSQTEEDQVA
ncbi:MAG: HNH endonuclease [Verrucomicrobiales bacterium]